MLSLIFIKNLGGEKAEEYMRILRELEDTIPYDSDDDSLLQVKMELTECIGKIKKRLNLYY